jgi:DDE family transposase
METNKSALQVMLRAYQIAQRVWPDYSSLCSRREFTQPQLFACLAVREVLRLSYRKTEVFLADVPDWLGRIGLRQTPDHNTLWRAFARLLKPAQLGRALDLLARHDAKLNRDLLAKPLSIDSTCYEDHHRSDHYRRVCDKRRREEAKKGRKVPGSWGRAVNAARRRRARAMPKLTLAVAAASHRILAFKATLGGGSDIPDFVPMLAQALRRGKVKTVVADAGYDSEDNHETARLKLKVRSVIPAKIGRPSAQPPAGRYRRLMKKRFARKADAKTYGQRAQSETVNSMMKRNLGDSLRSIRPDRRKQELLLRSLVHNLMLDEGRD